MSAWLFDLGNTRLKCAPLVDGRVGEVFALPHRESDLAAALDATLPARIDVAYVASVANEGLRVALLLAHVGGVHVRRDRLAGARGLERCFSAFGERLLPLVDGFRDHLPRLGAGNAHARTTAELVEKSLLRGRAECAARLASRRCSWGRYSRSGRGGAAACPCRSGRRDRPRPPSRPPGQG